ncbi:MAG: polyprenyl synthetase family protein [Ruminococcus sp.]|nr:polyprenyl synthetase family protein [Ruminococcus sp.]
MNFNEAMKIKTEAMDDLLFLLLPGKQGYQHQIMETMNYSIMAGGKRIRPILMYESFRLFGGEGPVIEKFMAAIEMIHTYSLVHDDLPAMDNDEYRRGKKTTHAEYGEAMGVLTGDALLNYAYETAFRALTMPGVDTQRVAKALAVLAEKSGVYGMVGGQVIDVVSEEAEEEMTEEKLKFMYVLKTAALIEAALMIGAILAGADEDQVNRMAVIGRKVGTAYQIQDDILDVMSTDEVLGKPVNSDEKNKKITYVTLKGIDAAKAEVKRLSEEAIAELKKFEPEDEFLELLLKSLMNREK